MNCSVIVVSKASFVPKIAIEEEPLYGAKYRVVKISDNIIEVSKFL